MQETQLIKLEGAKRALIEAKSLDEIKNIMDSAIAFKAYAKAAQMGIEMQNDCAEIKLRAERKAGELLKEMEKNKGGQAERKSYQSHNETSRKPKLKDLGINKTQSHRWQKVADIPLETFESHIHKTKEKKEELTTVSVLQIANKIRNEEKKEQIKKEGDRLKYLKENPQNCPPKGTVKYGKSGHGWDCKFTVVGQINGLPIIHCQCIDPEYFRLEENSAPDDLCDKIIQSTSSLEQAARKIKTCYKKFGDIIFDAYKLSWEEGIIAIYPKLEKAYNELRKVMDKIVKDKKGVELKKLPKVERS